MPDQSTPGAVTLQPHEVAQLRHYLARVDDESLRDEDRRGACMEMAGFLGAALDGR